MAANSTLQAVPQRGWLQGYANLVHKENGAWWNTRTWLLQIIIWAAIINGVMAMVLFVSPLPADGAEAMPGATETALMLFLVMGSFAPAVGTVIIAQDAIIEEKQKGTAAWLLSKPISRSAFILSKLMANALGMLVTMVLVQGALAYAQLWIATGRPLPVLEWLGALGLIFVWLLFYLTLTIMLGTLFQQRGPVIGIPMVLLFGYQFIQGMAPWMVEVIPHSLVLPPGEVMPSLAQALITGQPLPTLLPLGFTAACIVLFTGIAIWRFQREEF